jgi:hypothetical protein
VSSFSNKSWSRNFVIDCKVFFMTYFITLLWSIYVLNPCFTPLACMLLRTWKYTLIYTANVFYPRCAISFRSHRDSQRFSMCSLEAWDSSLLGYATFRSSLLRIDLRHTSCRNTMYSVFACAGSTGDSAFSYLSKASAENVLLPVDWAQTQLDLVCPVKCH